MLIAPRSGSPIPGTVGPEELRQQRACGEPRRIEAIAPIGDRLGIHVLRRFDEDDRHAAVECPITTVGVVGDAIPGHGTADVEVGDQHTDLVHRRRPQLGKEDHRAGADRDRVPSDRTIGGRSIRCDDCCGTHHR
ncbi:MAG: hypothetical protein ABIR68_14710, partial [Ilumatobacteraceae bacterium]